MSPKDKTEDKTQMETPKTAAPKTAVPQGLHFWEPGDWNAHLVADQRKRGVPVNAPHPKLEGSHVLSYTGEPEKIDLNPGPKARPSSAADLAEAQDNRLLALAGGVGGPVGMGTGM